MVTRVARGLPAPALGVCLTLILLALLGLGWGLTAQAAPLSLAVPCDTTALIDAINAANASGDDTLDLEPACIYTLTAIDNVTDGSNGLPSITSILTINGNGATIQRSDATPDFFRIFHVAAGADLTLNELTVSNGYEVGYDGGGGIHNLGAAMLTDVTISGNYGYLGAGGIHNAGTMVLTNSTLSDNECVESGDGGAITNAGSGTLTLTNSTVSGNHSAYVVGGILNAGTLALINSTVSGNTSLYGVGGIDNSGTVELVNTIVANSPEVDCAGAVSSLGHNLDSDGTCNLVGPGDLPGTDPLLGPLQDNGGATWTHAPLPGSPVVDAGDDAACPATDQRGVLRPQGPACDIGSVELAATCFAQADSTGVIFGSADGSAVQDAVDAAVLPGELIKVAGTCSGTQGRPTPPDYVDPPASGIIMQVVYIDKSLTLRGGYTADFGEPPDPSANPTTLDAQGQGRVLYVGGDIDLTIEGLSITGGNAEGLGGVMLGHCGGGIFNNGAELTLSNSTVSDNVMDVAVASFGGGIYSNAGNLELINSTVTDNAAGAYGGIYNSGAVTLDNSTVSGNVSSVEGGGIHNAGTAELIDSTISNNNGYLGAGGIQNAGDMVLTNSTVSDNECIESGDGGGITNAAAGTLTLNNSAISDNHATYGTGGIRNLGILALNDSTVNGNTAYYGDGGMHNSGYMVVDRSTVRDNSVGISGTSFGAAGIHNSGTMALTNSTLSGNASDGPYGGGIHNSGTVEMTNSTVSSNSSNGGGGGIDNSGTVEAINTIVANNSGVDCAGLITSLGHNLDSDSTCNLVGPGDLPGTDPQLGPLQDNGGPTWTHAPLPGSPAIDAGDDAACPATDQRGVLRPQGPACDIGSVELAQIHVGNIEMEYRARGPALYNVTGSVLILDQALQPVRGATVEVEWALPNGDTEVQSGVTRGHGSATFKLTSAQQGLYTLTVLNVAAPGYGYDPSANSETSDSVTVP